MHRALAFCVIYCLKVEVKSIIQFVSSCHMLNNNVSITNPKMSQFFTLPHRHDLDRKWEYPKVIFSSGAICMNAIMPITSELAYDGPLYAGLLAMTDNMLGPSPMHINYVSYVYDRPIFLVPLSLSYASSPVYIIYPVQRFSTLVVSGIATNCMLAVSHHCQGQPPWLSCLRYCH